MALALVLAITPEPEGLRVSFDIGKNRYWRWQLGAEPVTTGSGLASVGSAGDSGVLRASLQGPLPPQNFGRGEFLLPSAQLGRERRFMQLLSYRTEEGMGPALSAVVELPLSRSSGQIDRSDESGEDLPPPLLPLSSPVQRLPLAAMSQLVKKDSTMTASAFSASAFSPALSQVDSVPFSLRERPLSGALFSGADIVRVLMPMLPSLAPAINSLISGVAPAVGQVTSQLLTPDNIRQLMQLITAATGGVATTGAVPAVAASGARAASLSYARASSRYSEAKVAPALLAALPALMPLLQQVLSPQTVQSIVEAPQRMTGQIINGITDFARLGLQADQQLNDHLRALNPGVDDPALHQLLAGMSLGLSSARQRNYKRVASVRLSLASAPTQVLVGRTQVLYQQGRDWLFPTELETPETLNEAELLVQVKQADNLRVVHETSERIASAGSGPLELTPQISAAEGAKLQAGKEHIVVVSLLWRNRKGQLRGTSVQQSIVVMGTCQFDRIEESSELIPLADRELFRDYWHEVWNHDFTGDSRRVDLHSRYYLKLSPERQRNARTDTQLKRRQEGPRQTINLRAGYEFSVFALNHLLVRLAPDQPPLNDEYLTAIASSEFGERFNQAAQHQAQLRGRPGERASLWVFPVMKLQTLILVRAGAVDENGAVETLNEESVVFPIPAMLHFVGVKQS